MDLILNNTTKQQHWYPGIQWANEVQMSKHDASTVNNYARMCEFGELRNLLVLVGDKPSANH